MKILLIAAPLLCLVAAGCVHRTPPAPAAAATTPPGLPECPYGMRFVGVAGRSSHERLMPGMILVPFGVPTNFVVCAPVP